MAKWLLVVAVFTQTLAFALPNPSAVYCVENGGKYDVRTDTDGNQDGVCMFDNEGVMTECGGWAYLRGECSPGECLLWSVETSTCETMME